MTYSEAIKKYGSDKPDIRYGMEFGNLNEVAQGKIFKIFDSQEAVLDYQYQMEQIFHENKLMI